MNKNCISLGVRKLDKAGILDMLKICGLEMVAKATMNEVNRSTKFAIFCHNCYNTMKCKKKIPRMSVSNGLELDEIPYELKIPTDLEQQLFASCLIFMKVTELPKTRMKGQLDGKMINVPLNPSDISNTITSLPRCVDDAAIVPLQIKRKQEYKHAHVDGFIRPNVCINAVQKLKDLGNPHYQDIEINYSPLGPPPSKKRKLDEDASDNEENQSENEEDAKIPLLNNVKEFQADHVENTCLIREDLESRIVENRTNKVIKKKVKGKEPPISVQPGEGKVHFFSIKFK